MDEDSSTYSVRALRKDDKIILATADSAYLADSVVQLCLILATCSSREVPAFIFVRPFYKQLRWNSHGALEDYQHDPRHLAQWPVEVFIPRTFTKGKPISYASHLFGIDTLLNSSPDGFDFCNDLWLLLDTAHLDVRTIASLCTLTISPEFKASILDLLTKSELQNILHQTWSFCLYTISDPFSETLWLFQHQLLRPFLEFDFFTQVLLSEVLDVDLQGLIRLIHAYCAAAPHTVTWIQILVTAAIEHSPSLRKGLKKILQYLHLVSDVQAALQKFTLAEDVGVEKGLPQSIYPAIESLLIDHVPYGHLTILSLHESLNYSHQNAFSTQALYIQRSHPSSELNILFEACFGDERHLKNGGSLHRMLSTIRPPSTRHLSPSMTKISTASSVVTNVSFYRGQLGFHNDAINVLSYAWAFFVKRWYPGLQLLLVVSAALMKSHNATGAEPSSIDIMFQTLRTLLYDHFLHEIIDTDSTLLQHFPILPRLLKLLHHSIDNIIPSGSDRDDHSTSIDEANPDAIRSYIEGLQEFGTESKSSSLHFIRRPNSRGCELCRAPQSYSEYCTHCGEDVCGMCLKLPYISKSRFTNSLATSTQQPLNSDRGNSNFSTSAYRMTLQNPCLRMNIEPLIDLSLMLVDSYIGTAQYSLAQELLWCLLHSDLHLSDDCCSTVVIRLIKVLRRLNIACDDRRYLTASQNLLNTLNSASAKVLAYALDEVELVSSQLLTWKEEEAWPHFVKKGNHSGEKFLANKDDLSTIVVNYPDDNDTNQRLRFLLNQIQSNLSWIDEKSSNVENADTTLTEVRHTGLSFEKTLTRPNMWTTASDGIGFPLVSVDREAQIELNSGPHIYHLRSDAEEESNNETPARDNDVANDYNLTGLHLAAFRMDDETVTALIDQGEDVNLRDKWQKTPLHWAVYRGHETTIDLLLTKGASINATDIWERTPLHDAARQQRKGVTELLISKGANVKARDRRGRTPIHYAAEHGVVQIVKFLLDHGAEFNVRDKEQATPLGHAITHGHYMTVALLLARGADVEAEEGLFSRSALQSAAENGHNRIVTLLLDWGANIEAKDKDGCDALHYATEYGHESTVALLLRKGAVIGAKDKDGLTPLHRAAIQGRDKLVALLLDHGAEVSSYDNSMTTPLRLAVICGHNTTVALLLDQGAMMETQDGTLFGAAIHSAILHGHHTIVALLLDRGVDIEARDKLGWRALHCAAERGYDTSVAFLLDRGAQIVARDPYGRSALHFAAGTGHDSIVALLLDRGADIEARDTVGRSALHEAVQQGRNTTVKILLARGANINATTSSGITPLSLARKYERGDTLLLLLENGAKEKLTDRFRRWLRRKDKSLEPAPRTG